MSSNVANYKIQIDAEISNLETKLDAVKKSMKGLLDSGGVPEAQKMFDKIGIAIDNLKKKSLTPVKDSAVFSSLLRDAAEVSLQVDKLGGVITKVQQSSNEKKIDFLPKDLQSRVANVTKAIEAFEQAQEKAEKKTEKLTEAEKRLKSAAEALIAAKEKRKAAENASNIQKKNVADAEQELDLTKKRIQAIKDYQKALKDSKTDPTPANNSKAAEAKKLAVATGYDVSSEQKMTESLAQLEAQQRRQSMAVTDAINIERQYDKELSKANTTLANARQAHKDLKANVKQLQAGFESTKNTHISDAFKELYTVAEQAGVSLENIPTEYSKQGLEQLKNAANQLATNGIETLNTSCKTVQSNLTQVGKAAEQTKISVNANAEAFRRENAAASEVQGLISRIKYFVGLQGAVMMARRTLRQAFQTIKELDAAMTEMSVVTDETISDYWKRLPEFTESANQLGVSIKGAYEATTLYLQQGLKMTEAQEIANQTLKMGRIAGLEAEDATNKMTAALRGFNMELNETSAQRVADVYSELAAITASDVDEISSAMTKTASIASNAGMEFETTAAFLSQIIETTRESAETAGTALKTVIARFQELKKDPAEIGEVDGETIDANKIETALRSVGVALRDTSGQFRDLDDVFIELASKWDGLDTNTQRYIATIAAGSRQQSRFIAMMSDYSRTQELVTAANSSAGASNVQFEKTLESLESKLAQLKNSWDTFTMSIMNNQFVKIGIDILNGILSVINGVVAAFDRIGLGSVVSLGMVIGALVLGTKALNAFEINLRQVDKNGKRTYTTLGAIGATIKGTRKEVHSLSGALKNSNTQFALATAEIKKYAGSSIRVAMAEKQVNKAQTELNLLEKSGTATTAQLTSARLRLSAAERDLARQQEIYSGVKARANSIQALGFTATEAELLSLQKLTAEEIENLLVTEMNNGASAEEARHRLLSALGIQSETNALTLNDLVRRNGLLNFLMELGLLILGKKSWKDMTREENKNTASKGMQTIATLIQAAANGTLLATMWPILVATLAIAGAALILVGIIMLIVGAIKKAKANSPEGELKAAQEATEKMSKAADAAAESYNTLVESFERLEEKESALEGLTEGTEEWKDAVKDVNEEVMNLVDNFPALAQHLKIENGQLFIDEEAKDQILTDAEIAKVAAANAENAAKIVQSNAEEKVQYKNLRNREAVGHEGALFFSMVGKMIAGAIVDDSETIDQARLERKAQQEKNRKDSEAFARALARGWIQTDAEGKYIEPNEEALKQLAELGLTEEEIKDFGKQLGTNTRKLKEWGKQLEENDKLEEAWAKSKSLEIASIVDTSGWLKKDQDVLSGLASGADAYNNFVDKASAEVAKLKSDINTENKAQRKESYKKWVETIYADATDIVADKKGNVTFKLNGEDMEFNSNELTAAYTEYLASKEAKAAFETIPRMFQKATKDIKLADNLQAAITDKEGGALTRNQKDELINTTDDALKTVYANLEESQKAIFGSEQNFIESIRESAEMADSAFDQVDSSFRELAGNANLHESMSVESAKGYIKQMEFVLAAAGEAGVNTVDNALDAVADGMSQSDFNSFMGQLNAMDWKNLEDWENLPETLEKIGLSVPEDELEEFILAAQKSAGAIHNVDFDKLNEELSKLANIKNQISSGEQTRTFSSENYETLIKADSTLAKFFAQDLSGNYIYLGNSMKILTEAINKNTEALLNEGITQLQDKINAADIIGEDIVSQKNSSDKEQEKYLTTVLNILKESGVDLKNLGIAGLTNFTDVKDLDSKAIDTILDELLAIYNSKQSNKETLETKTRTSGIQQYLTEDAWDNAERNQKIYRSGQIVDDEVWKDLSESASALTIQAIENGINQIDVDKYTKTLEEVEQARKKYKQTGKEADRVELEKVLNKAWMQEEKLVNLINRSRLNTSLTEIVQLFGNFSEEFDNLLNESDKIEKVAQVMDNFGIEINESNYQDYADLIKGIIAKDENSVESLRQFLIKIGDKYNIAQEDIERIMYKGYSGDVENMSEDMKNLFDILSKNGLGTWEKLADGASMFSIVAIKEIEKVAEEISRIEFPYDWLYNSDENLEAIQREREAAERAYERAKAQEVSNDELSQVIANQLEAINKEIAEQQLRHENSIKDMNSLFANLDSSLLKYVNFNQETGAVNIDYEKAKLEIGQDADLIAALQAFEEDLIESRNIARDSQDALEESYDELSDISDEIEEIEEPDMDAVSELMNSIRDGIVKMRQDEIDELQKNTEAINEAESNIYDQIQKQVDEYRTSRDNKKTEKELLDKQARLAYLMRDSGANSNEIAKLQKEIDEGQESYQDTLVDQALQDLSDANELAAEQRQTQIDVMQEQLDAYAESKEIWSEVQQILSSGEQEVLRIVGYAQEIEKQNPIEQQSTRDEISTQFEEYEKWLSGEYGTNTKLGDIGGQITSKLSEISGLISGLSFNKVVSPPGDNGDFDIEEGTYKKASGGYETSINMKLPTEDYLNNLVSDKTGWYLYYDGYWLKKGEDFEYDTKTQTLSLFTRTDAEAKTDTYDIKDTRSTELGDAPLDIAEQVRKEFGSSSLRVDESNFVSEKPETQNQTQSDNTETGLSREVKVNEVNEVNSTDQNNKTSNTTNKTDDKEETYTAQSPWTSAADAEKFGIYLSSPDELWTDNTLYEKYKGNYQKYLDDVYEKYRDAKLNVTSFLDEEIGGSLNLDDLDKGKKDNGLWWNGVYRYSVKAQGPENRQVSALARFKKIPNLSFIQYEGQWYAYKNQKAYPIIRSDIDSKIKGKYLDFKQYKTGGLADFTGPAWLDGTKSRPEMVLNQQDTANFIQLKDILSEILTGTSSINKNQNSTNSGDNYFDIDISVENIEDDYGVEQMAEKIKDMIYEDATYRNVNTINSIS